MRKIDLNKLNKEELLELCDKVGVHPNGTVEELKIKQGDNPRFNAMANYPDK